MKMTTLCYIENEKEEYLMLHRTKKEQDPNEGKWIGIGGKFLEKESPEECVCREVLEETGLTLTDYEIRGIVTFISDLWETEYMYLFTAKGYEGMIKECDEGELLWVKKVDVEKLKLWEGDRIFLDQLTNGSKFFLLKLVYEGDRLVDYTLS